jgi:hypothetical protein
MMDDRISPFAGVSRQHFAFTYQASEGGDTYVGYLPLPTIPMQQDEA